jgi:tetratricopeptide (TPR) repeat protein
VAQCIENASFGYQDDYLAVVAQHYLYAEEWMIAFYYHKEAGIRAQKRYANHEALDLFGAALEIAPVLQEAMEQNETGSETYTHDLFASFCPFFPLRIQVAELHERQGYIHALLGESEQAIACYLQALEIINHLAGEYEQWNVSSANLDRFQKSLSCSTVRLHRHIATLEEQQTRYDSATDWLERGMEHIITRSRDELARCYLLGARIAYSQGEIEKAKEWASLGSAVAEYLDNQADQAQALLRLGNLRAEEGEFAESIPVLEQACHLFEQLNMISNLNYALSDLGLTYNDVGRWQDAITCYEQSLQISETIGDRMAIARTSNNLALALLGRGDLQRARELYEYSCEQFRQLGSEQGISLTMLNLGEVLLLQGKPLEAMEYFRESMEIIERTNARLDLPEVLRLVAEAMLNLEDYDQATTYALQSRDIANEQSMATEVAMAERVLGQVALKREDFVTASEYLQRSRTSLEQLEKRYEVGKVLFWQAHLAYARSRLDEMRSLLDQAEEIFRELDAQRDLELVNLLKHASVTLS